MEEVRLAVQRALDKLINRFGNPNDVIRELRRALDLIDAGTGQGSEASTGTPPTPIQEASPPVSETEQKAEGSGSKPQGRTRSVKRGNR